jgi:hypothetical protein
MRVRVAIWVAFVIAGCGGAQEPQVVERTFEGETEVEVEEIPVSEGMEAVPGGPPLDSRDPGTFPRNQPPVRDLVRWNGTFVVEADQRYTLDLAAGEAHPLALAGADEVLAIATQGPAAVALVRRGSERLLLATADDRWIERALPEALRASTAPLTLAADPGSLVLLASDRLHRLRGTTWTSVAVGAPPRELRGGPAHTLLAGDRLYLGWDSGEWGGTLLVLDASTGQWSVGPHAGTPVHDIVRAPDGVVWVATGLAHLGGRRGALHRHDAASWTTVVATNVAQHEQNQGWNLPPDSFQSIAFAADGTLHVLTGTLGVVRRDASGAFHQRTRSWPAARYLYVQALELEGEQAIIASNDAGVWVWDLGGGGVRRIVLREAAAAAPSR